jgi:ATP-dependent Clp protease ATP-binding subunit ClpA
MFSFLRRRFAEMRTVSRLLESADSYAREQGREQPGSEHLLLAALELPDGKGRKVFDSFGVNADVLKQAIHNQHRDALARIGVTEETLAAGFDDVDPPPERILLPRAQESAVSVLRRLARREAPLPRDVALNGALIVACIAAEKHSIAARALSALNLDPERLHAVALVEAVI